MIEKQKHLLNKYNFVTHKTIFTMMEHTLHYIYTIINTIEIELNFSFHSKPPPIFIYIGS